MLKSLTLSLSLAVALGFCSVSQAGGHHGLASAQEPMPSTQCPTPSPQGECFPTGCGEKKCSLFSCLGGKMNNGYHGLCKMLKPKPKCYTYEWVLKKKKVRGHHNPCSSPSCDTCSIYPSSQGGGYSSPQASIGGGPGAYGSGQGGYGSGQGGFGGGYGSGQGGYGGGGGGQAGYGAGGGQPSYGSAPAGAMAPASIPATGDEAPPAPEVAPTAPAAPNGPPATPAPAPPAPGAQSSLLFSTPSGN
ncbi:MAG: hypothetical protein NVSMB9_13150 [Isosphaeraceae bacterium]